MNGRNSHNLLSSPGVIAIACGLVGCISVGVVVGLKEEARQVAIGAGVTAATVGYCATWLQQRGSDPERIVQVQIPQPVPRPEPVPNPVQPIAAPADFQPTGQGSFFYIEAASADWVMTALGQPAQTQELAQHEERIAPPVQHSTPPQPYYSPEPNELSYPEEVVAADQEEQDLWEERGNWDEAIGELPDLSAAHDFYPSGSYRR